MAEKALVIVESPHKAKTISKILGPDYTIRATVGHIVDLKKGGGTLGINIEKGFEPQYQVIPDKKDKIKAIIDAARHADIIYIASDPDREGEAIAFAVADQLKKLNKKIKRAEFLEITPAAVKKGIANPRDLDNDLYAAQQARRVLDRIVGFLVSPYLSKKYGETLSAGRVQSVALRLVVDRENEINSFIPEDYFVINVNLAKGKEKIVAKYPFKISEKERSDEVVDDLKKCKSFVVSNLIEKDKEKPALPPLTTSTLQQLASAKYKLAADKTMAAAQRLYENGHITYIRTDSVRNSPESIQELREFLQKQKLEIPNVPNIYTNKDSAQDAHEALRPTSLTKPFLENDEEKVYNLIWTRFVASQMKPAIFSTVEIEITADNHKLVAEGKTLKYAGWLEMASSIVKNDKDVVLPKLKINDKLSLIKPGVVCEHKQTKPPSRYSDGTLVKELEHREIGRPSTYASIIKLICSKNYINKTKNGFVPSDVGVQVVDDLKQYFSFMDFKYTAKMEKELDKIAAGDLEYKEMLSSFFKPFKTEFYTAKMSQGTDVGILCPECGDKTVVLHGQFGYYAACVKKPACKGTVSVDYKDGKYVVKSKFKLIENVLCPSCNSPMVRIDGKFGPYYGCSQYLKFKCIGKRKIPFGKKCPNCNDELYLTIFSGVFKLACMGYPNCKTVIDVPDGAKIDWIDPKNINPPSLGHKVDKAVKKL